jgi:hypothetical protein
MRCATTTETCESCRRQMVPVMSPSRQSHPQRFNARQMGCKDHHHEFAVAQTSTCTKGAPTSLQPASPPAGAPSAGTRSASQTVLTLLYPHRRCADAADLAPDGAMRPAWKPPTMSNRPYACRQPDPARHWKTRCARTRCSRTQRWLCSRAVRALT